MQEFSCEFYDIFENTFTEQLWKTFLNNSEVYRFGYRWKANFNVLLKTSDESIFPNRLRVWFRQRLVDTGDGIARIKAKG